MIHGIGVDLCDIARMEKAIMQKGFREKVFSAEEIEYAERSSSPAKHYASAFAAKEALAKATGWGLAATGLDSCLVRRTDNGPVFVFTAEIQNKLTEAQIGTAFLSLSHEGTNAVAMVVLERNHD